ncbi:MAG: HD domain-containing protein [Actinobacteria bacterium]|nr:HD domain-containing protein [Actinomycetota bacterium]
MIKQSLLLKIYEAASMQRWNDQIRMVELTELDKQAHKMIAAYILGKCQENNNFSDNYNGRETGNVSWLSVIEAGLFEYLQRIILTDLKPPLFYQIKQDKKKYRKLNQWVFEKINPVISCLGERFCNRFYNYLMNPTEDINREIIGAAHFYITKWEFEIIRRFNPKGYQIEEIEKSINKEQEKYNNIYPMKRLMQTKDLVSFIDICGQLRFQIRWSHLYRVPKTSVLGHMLIVAIFSYLFSLIAGENEEKCINNYFTGLFHDLPEVLTRDIINPVKKSVEGLDDLIKEYEKSEMDKKIYKLIPVEWHTDMRMYTENEFENTANRDGKMVKAADDLAAFIEAYLSVKNGIHNENLMLAMDNLRSKYNNKIISGIDFGLVYKEFE